MSMFITLTVTHDHQTTRERRRVAKAIKHIPLQYPYAEGQVANAAAANISKIPGVAQVVVTLVREEHDGIWEKGKKR